MRTALPARRFREAQLLIGAAIVMVLLAVLVELRGVLELAGAAEAGSRATAVAAARAAAAAQPRGGALGTAPAGVGVALLAGDAVVARAGAAGPDEPAWWPWHSRLEW